MDFALTMVNNKPEALDQQSDGGILNDLILSLHLKARSTGTDEAGRPLYAGDWFLDPEYGQNIYEVDTTVTDNLQLVESYAKRALQWLIDAGKASSIEVVATKPTDRNDQIAIQVSARQINGTAVSFTFFQEVV